MHRLTGAAVLLLGWSFAAQGQIDPEKRQLLQLGYNLPLEGRGPVSGYAFYYRNDPGFLRTNLTLRLAIAPVYIDSELGFSQAMNPRTDLAFGLAGGGFADSYSEVRGGKLYKDESFTGHGGEMSFSLYHCFNPTQLIPLNAVLRLSPHFSTFQEDSRTDPAFELPEARTSINLRAGLRLGGKEPKMFPDLGLELSGWYEGQFRTESGRYGFDGDRRVEPVSHLFWGRALFIYTLPTWKHNFSVNLTAGTSLRSDRFSAYRLGGLLPLVAEFPLTLPGYYFQEISARRFALLSGQYTLPLDHDKRWTLTALGTVARVDYLSGLDQPGSTHSGVGLGVGYKSPKNTYQVVAGYAYGFNAIRSHGEGAHNIGILFQWDLEAKKRPQDPYFDLHSPYKSRGLFRIFGN